MQGFQFQTIKTILSEPGSSARLGELVKELGAERVLVVTDPGIKSLGLLDTALAGLEDAGVAVTLYDKVQADPPEASVLEAGALARNCAAGAVIGFGGGSSMDTAKLAAFLARSDQPLAEAYGVGNARGERLPLIQVPTTAGTGSEVTPIAIVTTGEATKMGAVSPILYADFAVLDADLTLGLPPKVTAATGVDAMVHAIEAYTTKLKKNPVSDALAREALSLLGSNIRTACEDGGNREARAAMLLGSLLAGMSFANAPCAAVHALAYPVGGHFHVPHGLSNSLVLPHVLRFNAPVAESQYAEIAGIAIPGLQSGDGMTERLAAGFESLVDDLAIESRLREVGVSHNQLPMMAEDAMKQQRLLVNNPREVAYDDALAIYQAAF